MCTLWKLHIYRKLVCLGAHVSLSVNVYLVRPIVDTTNDLCACSKYQSVDGSVVSFPRYGILYQLLTTYIYPLFRSKYKTTN